MSLTLGGNSVEIPAGLELQVDKRATRCRIIEHGPLRGLVLGDADEDESCFDEAVRALIARYPSNGVTALEVLRGDAVLLLWDRDRQRLVVGSAPGSLTPLYYASTPHGLWFANQSTALIRDAGVSNRTDRLTLTAHLSGLWPEPSHTYFEDIRRLPPTLGLVWSRDHTELRSVWQPVPDREAIEWIGDAAVDLFEPLFEAAVDGALGRQRAGVFLSGGLDSVSVALVARDLAKRRSQPLPLALSLDFPDPDCSEGPLQQAITAELGLEQILIGLPEALAGRSPMAAALELTAVRPSPLLNFWQPAYVELARRAAQLGCRRILTGNGGDEWLSVTPYLAADYWRRCRLPSLLRLWNSLRRSYRLSVPRMSYNLIWPYGLRPLLADFTKSRLSAHDPRRFERMLRRRRTEWRPPWLTRRRELLDAVVERSLEMELWDREEARTNGYYLREMRKGVDHFLVCQELEESDLLGRETGIRMRQPFTAPDLLEFLARVRPEVLAVEGRSKGLVRKALSARFPGLGFDAQRKVQSTGFYRRCLLADLTVTWAALGGVSALAELDVVDPDGVDLLAEEIATGSEDHHKVHDLWTIINLETWLRAWG